MTLYIVRGLPGSGKSTLAKRLLNQGQVQQHWEADMYFTQETGVYKFDPTKLSEAHSWCQSQVKKALEGGHSVVVSNTFVKHWEMRFYKELAKNLQVNVQELVCEGNYRNIHGVPEAIVERMRSSWES